MVKIKCHGCCNLTNALPLGRCGGTLEGRAQLLRVVARPGQCDLHQDRSLRCELGGRGGGCHGGSFVGRSVRSHAWRDLAFRHHGRTRLFEAREQGDPASIAIQPELLASPAQLQRRHLLRHGHIRDSLSLSRNSGSGSDLPAALGVGGAVVGAPEPLVGPALAGVGGRQPRLHVGLLRRRPPVAAAGADVEGPDGVGRGGACWRWGERGRRASERRASGASEGDEGRAERVSEGVSGARERTQATLGAKQLNLRQTMGPSNENLRGSQGQTHTRTHTLW